VPNAVRICSPLAKASGLFRLAALAALLSAVPAGAQELAAANSSFLPETPAPAQISLHYSSAAASPASPVEPATTPKNDRLFFLMPNYLTVENKRQVTSISAKTKFKLSEKTMTDPVTISFLGTLALLGQARNSNPSYGQELAGYAKRYGTLYADTGIATLMTTSVFPTLLHQDPRYFQLGTGSFWHRTKYSLSRILVTRSDAGEIQPNYSVVVGNAVAAGIASSYHPASQRTVGNTLGIWGTNLALNSLCNMAKEFWPDIRRKLRKPAALD